MPNQHHAASAAHQFQIEGELSAVTPYGSGHINDTYCAVFHQQGRPIRYILQRINTGIFRNPIALMENIQRVTSHLAAKSAAEPDRARRVLTLIPARDGHAWHVDAQGGYWRAYRFIEGAHAYDAVESAQQAYQAGKALGLFQHMLVDLPSPRLRDTIPDFHNTPKRFVAFAQAVIEDAVGRATQARAEIDFAFAHQSIPAVLLDANLPQRVTHNDTKFNNVLLDDETGEAVCVIDLDT